MVHTATDLVIVVNLFNGTRFKTGWWWILFNRIARWTMSGNVAIMMIQTVYVSKTTKKIFSGFQTPLTSTPNLTDFFGSIFFCHSHWLSCLIYVTLFSFKISFVIKTYILTARIHL